MDPREEGLLELRADLLEDYELYASTALKIRSKSGEIVPLKLNKAQRHLDGVVRRQIRERGYVRVLLLKARQWGGSTYVAGRGYWKTTQHSGIRSLILAHEDDATNKLFQVVRRFHEHCPAWLKPRTKYSNRQELDFAALDGGYRLATAGSPSAGRGDTVQFFHGSEVAFWRRSKEVLEGALQSLALEAGTEGYLESTANGRSGRFWELCDRALRASRGEIDPSTGQPYYSDWELVFVPWYWVEEYRSSPPPEFTPTKKELELAKAFDLGLDQLCWRRGKIEEFGGGEQGELSFRQEYPGTPDEAFLLSGRKFFDQAKVEAIGLKARESTERGNLEQVGTQVRFVAHEEGWLEVWQHPARFQHYVVGVDVAEGLESGDKHSIQVLLRGGVVRQVARASPLCDADEIGRRAVLVAQYYKGAWLGIERNGLGLAAVLAASKTQYRHLYLSQVLDEVAQRIDRKVGWVTNQFTRPLALGALQAAIRDGTILVRSPATARQLETFVVTGRGRPEAAQGANDDEVMALAIAVQLCTQTEPSDEGGIDMDGDDIGPPTQTRRARYGLDTA